MWRVACGARCVYRARSRIFFVKRRQVPGGDEKESAPVVVRRTDQVPVFARQQLERVAVLFVCTRKQQFNVGGGARTYIRVCVCVLWNYCLRADDAPWGSW